MRARNQGRSGASRTVTKRHGAGVPDDGAIGLGTVREADRVASHAKVGRACELLGAEERGRAQLGPEEQEQHAVHRLLRSLEEPQAYLFRIAANLIADRGRRGLVVVPLTDEMHPSIAPRQEERRRVVDLQQALEAALAELSPRARTIFVMRRFDEMGTGDIARALGISPRMVQKHLTHAVSHLYARLGHLREVTP